MNVSKFTFDRPPSGPEILQPELSAFQIQAVFGEAAVQDGFALRGQSDNCRNIGSKRYADKRWRLKLMSGKK